MQSLPLLLLEATSRHHLLCMFNAAVSWQTAVDRSVALIFALSMWNVSLRLDGPQALPEYAGQARVACEAVTKTMPFLTAHLTALKEGLPILRTMRVKEDDDEDEATAADIRGGRQSVLKAIQDAPSAKVVSLQPAKAKEPKAAAAKTRAGSSTDVEQAVEAERIAQERATQRAKRTRDVDVAKAAAAESSSKKQKKEFKAPRKVAGKKAKEQDKPDLGFLDNEEDEEPQ